MDKTNSLEADFAVGRPARSGARVTCTRCDGTGWWMLGRVCFRCGGEGNLERSTLATRIRDKRAHLEEVRGIIALNTKHLATAPRWGRKPLEDRIAERTAQLALLESELAALEAA